ncbi:MULTISPECIES: helix-turn-helix domain-containing protein [unclassified Adlercreutzia]|uniref:helix-turn-helix domain-containing protein n=1 Tax=unclassified Adlercreutzia TaxID=2636013 RepID=UPI0013E9A626|nr:MULTISPECIES: helix-turn-helix domain-containing protein [unclassified Adlercreutzia]
MKRERAWHLTRSQQQILNYLVNLTATDGVARCTKRDIAQAIGCSDKTADRALVRLRREGFVEASACFDESGAQIGNTYRVLRRSVM